MCVRSGFISGCLHWGVCVCVWLDHVLKALKLTPVKRFMRNTKDKGACCRCKNSAVFSDNSWEIVFQVITAVPHNLFHIGLFESGEKPEPAFKQNSEMAHLFNVSL